MATASTIPVRLPENLLTPLDAWAKAAGLSRAAAIKVCLAKQLGVIETADAAALAALDGRRYRYTRKEAEKDFADLSAEADRLLKEEAKRGSSGSSSHESRAG